MRTPVQAASKPAKLAAALLSASAPTGSCGYAWAAAAAGWWRRPGQGGLGGCLAGELGLGWVLCWGCSALSGWRWRRGGWPRQPCAWPPCRSPACCAWPAPWFRLQGQTAGEGGSGRDGRMIGQRCGRGAAAEKQAAWSAQAPPHPGPANCAGWRPSRAAGDSRRPTDSAHQEIPAPKPPDLGPPPTRPRHPPGAAAAAGAGVQRSLIEALEPMHRPLMLPRDRCG